MSEPIYNSAGEVLYPGLAGDGAGYRGSRLVTLKPESWEEAEGAWPLMQDAPVPEAKTGYAALGSSRTTTVQRRRRRDARPTARRGTALSAFTPGRSPPETSGCR